MVYLEAVLDEVVPNAVKKIASDLFAFQNPFPEKSMTFEVSAAELFSMEKFFLSKRKVDERRFTQRFEANSKMFRMTHETETFPDYHCRLKEGGIMQWASAQSNDTC